MAEKIYEYKDITRLTMIVRYLLIGSIGLAALGLVFGWFEYDLLTRADQGTFDSQQQFIEEAEASDMRVAILGGLQTIIALSLTVAIGMWIYRACANAHTMTTEPMEFSAGWAVGWYFIPIANLWKPYQALKETWCVSESPVGWDLLKRSGLLPLWWTIWLISNFVDNAGLRLALRAEDIDELLALNVVFQVSDFLTIPLCAVFYVIVVRLARMQAYRPQDVF